MNLVEKMRNYVASFFVSPKNVDITEVGLIDVYLEKTLQVLYWQSTERTLRVFFLLNTLFWIILMVNLRLYGVLSLLTLIAFIFDTWWRDTLYVDYKGEYSRIIKDLKRVVRKSFDILYELRKDSPVVFYPSVSLFFLTVHMLSKNAPGGLLIYLLFLSIFFLPIGFQLLPKEVSSKIKEGFKVLATPRCILAEDELIPFIQGKDFNKRDADLESLLTDRTADSVTNSLASGITSMPSYLEVVDSPNDIQEEDLIPCTTKSGPSFTPGELSSDSESDREIKFDSDHFNTSSSEDDPYSKDLTFPKGIQTTTREDISAGVGMFRSMINTVKSNIVANMFQSAIYSNTPSTRNDALSESDSDFEIVDPDEIAGDFKKDK